MTQDSTFSASINNIEFTELDALSRLNGKPSKTGKLPAAKKTAKTKAAAVQVIEVDEILPPFPTIEEVSAEVLNSIGQRKGDLAKKAAAPRKRSASLTPNEAKFEAQLKGIKQKAAEAQARTAAANDMFQLQAVLPMWDDLNRGVPNPLIRSGLFSVKNTKDRAFLKDDVIASLSNYSVRYTGQELQQDDLSVWMSLMNLARDKPINDMIFFTGYSLIKDMGWRMHKDSYVRIQESIQRLKVTGLQVSTTRMEDSYAGSLIRDFAWHTRDERGNAKWMVRFEPRVAALFKEDTTTLLEWETRKKIGSRATLALWLHTFYATHRDPIPFGIPKLYELCRSGDNLSSFRRNIRNALMKLVEAGFLKDFNIMSDTVHVHRMFGKARVSIAGKAKLALQA